MNDIKKLNELWQTANTLQVEIDGCDYGHDTYSLIACTVEENGAPRDATRAELDYFNDEFSGEIADEGAEYWYEKCH